MGAARLVIWPGPRGADLTRKCPVSRREPKLTRGGQSMIRQIKVGSVENIEHLGPKLQVYALANGEVLEQVQISAVGSARDAVARATVMAEAGRPADLAGHYMEVVGIESQIDRRIGATRRLWISSRQPHYTEPEFSVRDVYTLAAQRRVSCARGAPETVPGVEQSRLSLHNPSFH
jgi:hypothetical protein